MEEKDIEINDDDLQVTRDTDVLNEPLTGNDGDGTDADSTDGSDGDGSDGSDSDSTDGSDGDATDGADSDGTLL